MRIRARNPKFAAAIGADQGENLIYQMGRHHHHALKCHIRETYAGPVRYSAEQDCFPARLLCNGPARFPGAPEQPDTPPCVLVACADRRSRPGGAPTAGWKTTRPRTIQACAGSRSAVPIRAAVSHRTSADTRSECWVQKHLNRNKTVKNAL